MIHFHASRLSWFLGFVIAVALPACHAPAQAGPAAGAGAGAGGHADAAQKASEAEPLRVLFVGNSYTAYFAIPKQVAAMCAHAGVEVQIKMVTRGGWSWKRHWEEGPAPEVIREGGWDVVVLQEYSRGAMDKPEAFDEFGQKLVELVKSTGAKPVLYLTWARQHLPQDQATLTGEYAALAERTGAGVAPVGVAWQRWFAEVPGVPLHRKDRSHPNRLGAYLSACVMFATITGQSPAGQVHVIAGRDVVEKTDVLVDLPAKDAELLQRCAWETVQGFSVKEAASAFASGIKAEPVTP